MDKYLVVNIDNENFEIFEKVEKESIDGQKFVMKESRGTFNLAGAYGEKVRLEELLGQVSIIIQLIEDSKNESSSMVE